MNFDFKYLLVRCSMVHGNIMTALTGGLIEQLTIYKDSKLISIRSLALSDRAGCLRDPETRSVVYVN